MHKLPDDHEVPLHGILAEFRAALRSEIEAARRHESSSGVALINGRRIGQVGSEYQYVFDIENPLNLPGDAPGDLYVPGRLPISVVVISIEGLAVTLSVAHDLGKFVPNARLQSNLAHLMRKLIQRIEGLAETPNPTGERIRGALPVSGSSGNVDLPGNLNPEQREAVASSLRRDTTFIWGPPGTGKTKAIGAIAEQLYRLGRSVLLVSHTNTAVDGALVRIGEQLDDEVLAKGRVVRVGQPTDKLKGYDDILLETHIANRSKELAAERDKLEALRETAVAAVRDMSRKINVCEWVVQMAAALARLLAELDEIQRLECQLRAGKAEGLRLAAEAPRFEAGAEAGRRAKSYVANIVKIDEFVGNENRRLAITEAELQSLGKRLKKSRALQAEAAAANWLTRFVRGLPSPRELERLIREAQAKTARLAFAHDEIVEKINDSGSKKKRLAEAVASFERAHGGSPKEVLRRAEAHAARRNRVQRSLRELDKVNARRMALTNELTMPLQEARELRLTSASPVSAEKMLRAIKAAYDVATEEVSGSDVGRLMGERDRLNKHIRDMDAAIGGIEEALKNVEKSVVADAAIVATTLTRAYLRESIQSRRFDTVILDEASMAPIPALWVAASLADKNAVVVGDPRQLPPIVLSKDKLSQRWLGKDIFDEAGLTDYSVQKPYLVMLKTQYRMHPEISQIPNELIYEGWLKDGEIEREGRRHPLSDDACSEGFLNWYRSDWGHDHPVLMVSTHSVGAWVTSASRGARGGRLNFLSATICVDLAEQLLSERREKDPGAPPRILIICPYRAHAKLLGLLLREGGLTGTVLAGTVHNFQGSEGDVVILDLVNDEPHWRVRMFTPTVDPEVKRLLNVALTRPRRRLIVVGDFKYIAKQAKKAFLGAKLIPLLQKRFPCVDATDVVPAGLAARAAKAQSAALTGEIEPAAKRIVVTQEHFYAMLRGDIARARQRVVIYSAFITSDRLAQLAPQLRAAVERGVTVYVVTKAHGDRGEREVAGYRTLERALTQWGVVVIHKRHMHEKLVFIDDEILWSGSLNPLSFSRTQEVMERRHSEKVVEDYAQTLRLDELLREYESGPPACPICGSEVVATEGTDEPFYWRCIKPDCYSRNVDQPALIDGEIVCANCGGEVVYGYWGEKPHWRCLNNRQHRRRVLKSHLRLPKMCVRIPGRELRKLEKLFGPEPAAKGQREATGGQPPLFDLEPE